LKRIENILRVREGGCVQIPIWDTEPIWRCLRNGVRWKTPNSGICFCYLLPKENQFSEKIEQISLIFNSWSLKVTKMTIFYGFCLIVKDTKTEILSQ
jgi:hypothetical protein